MIRAEFTFICAVGGCRSIFHTSAVIPHVHGSTHLVVNAWDAARNESQRLGWRHVEPMPSQTADLCPRHSDVSACGFLFVAPSKRDDGNFQAGDSVHAPVSC